jgi:hypothetical protein
MDSEYLQFVRYKLQKRLKRLNSAPFASFHGTLIQSWGFLHENEITRGILEDLGLRSAEQEALADLTISGTPQLGDSEAENDGICYWVVRKCALSSDPRAEVNVARHICNENKYEDMVEAFRLSFVEPLFDYIDEHIDDKRATLAFLRKYKHRCEWFRRIQLREKFLSDTQRGERLLADDLYEYLHDQGIEFHIEPSSASGRIDLVSSQTGKDRLVADAKIFNPERGQNTSYLAKGFRQVYDYTKDYNEQFGYIVIFKACQDDLSIAMPKQESSIPFISHNNKTIFFVVVDICEYEETASKRGKLKSYELTSGELIEALGQ